MQVPQLISGWILAHFTSKVVVLIVINLVLLLVGMVMDTTPAILILTPILLPIVEGFGMNPIHFGVMMVVNLAIGFVTPPIGKPFRSKFFLPIFRLLISQKEQCRLSASL